MTFARSCRRFAPALAFVLLFLPVRPAHAVNKDMIELQTEVQQLIDSVARLQQSNDQQMGVLKDLVQQTVDSVNKMSVTVNGLQLKLQNEGDAQSAKNDQISGQVQALNDSLDELKARMQRMEKTLTDLQSQVQSTNATLSNLPAAGGGVPTQAVPATGNPGPGAAAAPASGAPLPAPSETVPGNVPSGSATSDLSPTAPAGPTAKDAYRIAYNDYMAGKFPLATSEFSDLVKGYPDDNLAGNALFYIGEMDVRADQREAAIKSYNQLIANYPANVKIPAAELHKGEALLALHQTEEGAHQLRALVQRYPNSPEAAQARVRLSALSASARR